MPLRRELATFADLEGGAQVFPVGADLYRQGDICSAYYILLNGWIALSMLLDDGSCQILDFSLPGAVLGFQSGASAPTYHSARCLSVVRVYGFPQRKLDAIIESNPHLAVSLCRQITADEARAHDHLANLGLRGARERIARLLLEIYVRVRGRLPAEPGEVIQLPLSQNHIGQALGLTYVHVCRTLQILREQKIVRFANHRLEIIDPPALIGASGIEVDTLDCEHRVRSREPTRAGPPANRDVTGSLPAGWTPIKYNTPSRMPLALQRKAA
jgi:CRP/FNR family transcriptional regulator